MTIEEAREYWCRRLKRAEGYSDEHWDAEERHAHADYIDAMTHAITALAIYREREEAEKNLKTNADRIRQMTDEELAKILCFADCEVLCPAIDNEHCNGDCCGHFLRWLKQEVKTDDERR